MLARGGFIRKILTRAESPDFCSRVPNGIGRAPPHPFPGSININERPSRTCSRRPSRHNGRCHWCCHLALRRAATNAQTKGEYPNRVKGGSCRLHEKAHIVRRTKKKVSPLWPCHLQVLARRPEHGDRAR